jgi:hypothetical protein
MRTFTIVHYVHACKIRAKILSIVLAHLINHEICHEFRILLKRRKQREYRLVQNHTQKKLGYKNRNNRTILFFLHKLV